MDLESSIHVVKTKVLISFTVTVKLICAFVFTYAKCWFSHDMAQMCMKTTYHAVLWYFNNEAAFLNGNLISVKSDSLKWKQLIHFCGVKIRYSNCLNA